MNCTASGKHWQKSKHSTEMKGMTASKLCSLLTCINSNLAHLCEHKYPKKMKMHEKNCTTYLQTASASHVLGSRMPIDSLTSSPVHSNPQLPVLPSPPKESKERTMAKEHTPILATT